MAKFSTNIFYSAFGEILQFGLSFLLAVITARYLGAAGRGGFWMIYNVAGLLSIVLSMRFSQSLTYYLSKNKDMIGETILYGLFVGLITVSGITVIGIYFYDIFSNILLKDIKTNWSIIVLICASYYLWLLIIAIMEGLMLFGAKAVFMGGSYLIRICSVILGLEVFNLEFDGLMYFLGALETIIYFAIIMALFSKATHFRLTRADFRGLLRYSAGSFPGVVSNFYTLRIDGFFLNYFSGPAAVGIYSVGLNLIMMLLYLPTAIKTVLLPYIASFSAREMTPQLTRLLIIVMGFLSLVLIPVVWVAVIPIYGEEFEFSRKIFLLLLPGSIFWGVFLLLASDIEGRGMPWRISMVSMMSATATVVMGLILIPMWSVVGAAMVNSISHAITLGLALGVYKRTVGINYHPIIIPRVEDFYWFKKIINEYVVIFREMLLEKNWVK